ncbi:hypothetical protein [Rossellomorea aquimaris]|nr:hypothetical protein [Rossellomorea aquimaris]
MTDQKGTYTYENSYFFIGNAEIFTLILFFVSLYILIRKRK